MAVRGPHDVVGLNCRVRYFLQCGRAQSLLAAVGKWRAGRERSRLEFALFADCGRSIGLQRRYWNAARIHGEFIITGFEFLFSLYGLLLGLAVANATAVLAEFWRTPPERRGGPVTLLLGAFILLAATEQWGSFWDAREVLNMTPVNALVILAMALPYVFVSHGMSPADSALLSYGEYYLRHRRTLMVVLCIPPVVSLGYNVALQGVGVLGEGALYFLVIYGPRILIPVLLCFARSARWHVAGLILLNAHMVLQLFD